MITEITKAPLLARHAEYPTMRHLCDLETVKNYEGIDHIHALVIGATITGVAAYK
jgi:glutaryl-CoA dehydrogenase